MDAHAHPHVDPHPVIVLRHVFIACALLITTPAFADAVKCCNAERPLSRPCVDPSWTPTATPTNTPTVTNTPTSTHTPTLTFTPTNTPTITPTPTLTDTPTNTPTNTPSGNFASACYTGNATDNRSISGLGFQPDAVIVLKKSTATTHTGAFRNTSMTGDQSIDMITSTLNANRIQAFEADGFQVGTDTEVNANTIVYCYYAWKESTVSFKTGTYTGNATDNRSITGIGFQPEAVLVLAGNPAVWSSATMAGDLSCFFVQFASTCQTNRIQAMEADGFQIGTNGSVNTNLKVYYYLAWNSQGDVPNGLMQGTYTGDSSLGDRSVASGCTTLDAVFVDGNTATQANKCNGFSSTAIGALSDPYDQRVNTTDLAAGFSPPSGGNITLNGTDANCNFLTIVYYYMGWCQ